MCNVRKTFAGVVANDDASISFYPHEIHAILGENGAGKSTLMNILYGMLEPDSGTITIDDREVKLASSKDAIAAGMGMVHQDFLLIPRMTVTDNVLLGFSSTDKARAPSIGPLDRMHARERIKALSQDFSLDVDPDAIVDNLSVGAQQRVEILKLLYRDARLLILDEPTAVLTPPEAAKLFRVLRSLCEKGASIALITHKLDEVQSHSDRVTVMRRGTTIGTWQKRAMTSDELAAQMVGRDVTMVTREPADKPEKKDTVLQLSQFTVRDSINVERVKSVTLALKGGQILGIAGVDGNGQSYLVEAVAGLRRATHGQITLGGREISGLDVARRRAMGLKYVPADRRAVGSVHELSVAENLAFTNDSPYPTRGPFLDKAKARRRAQDVIDEFEVRTPGPDFQAGKLSGGNLQKVILGREISGEPRALIVEHPTRGLDVGAAQQLRRILLRERARGCSILLISADLDEIFALSDLIAVMFDGFVSVPERAEDITLDDVGRRMAGIGYDFTNGIAS